jgi:hypothetical protein
MPIIDPSRRTTATFVQLLRRQENFDSDSSTFELIEGACDTRYRVGFGDGPCVPPGEEESQRMREWFVRGDPMPPTVDSASGAALKHLHRSDLRTIQAWIGKGAVCP